jgi:Raf kinase inhibitor-like YbhB/YbcL family protein
MFLGFAATGIVVAIAVLPMQVTSSSVAAGAMIPTAFMAAACGGDNRSPELAWSGAPSGTRSLAIVMHDADAPIPGGFYHWVVYNLPPTMHGLDSAARLSAEQLGLTSGSRAEYHGPCPPPGPAHHYTITVYALDLARIAAGSPLTGAELKARIEGHVLGTAVFEALASR